MVSNINRIFLLVVIALTIGFLPPLMASDDAASENQEKAKKAVSKKSPYGPFRNDPTQGTPKHAYSPFDASSKPKTKDECEGNRCKFVEGTVLVKLISEEKLAKQSTGSTKLSADAVRQNIAKKVKAKKIKPVFANARPLPREKSWLAHPVKWHQNQTLPSGIRSN